MLGKEKRMGVHSGKTPDWKKAIVKIDRNPSEVTYLEKGGKEAKTNKKYNTENSSRPRTRTKREPCSNMTPILP
jgi:hypothetical protein